MEDDLNNFENKFKSPPGNYHCTCLYRGKDGQQPDPDHIYDTWQHGLPVPLAVDFVVYVPGYLMAGHIKKESLRSGDMVIKCANDFSHMTMLMKEGPDPDHPSAVESNDILKALHEGQPEVFHGIGQKRAVGLNIPYRDSKVIYVISNPFSIDGVTGSNETNGL